MATRRGAQGLSGLLPTKTPLQDLQYTHGRILDRQRTAWQRLMHNLQGPKRPGFIEALVPRLWTNGYGQVLRI
jgi:hypothetical protein